MPRQAGEWIRGTLEFVLLLLVFATNRQKKSRETSQLKIRSETCAISQRIQVTDLKFGGGQRHRSLIQTENLA
jgi:hypothetical protein